MPTQMTKTPEATVTPATRDAAGRGVSDDLDGSGGAAIAGGMVMLSSFPTLQAM
jgi:hypothetical protein